MPPFKLLFDELVQQAKWSSIDDLLNLLLIDRDNKCKASGLEVTLDHPILTEILQLSAAHGEWSFEQYQTWHIRLHKELLLYELFHCAISSSLDDNADASSLTLKYLETLDDFIVDLPEKIFNWIDRLATRLYEEGEQTWTVERIEIISTALLVELIKGYLSRDYDLLYPEIVLIPSDTYPVGFGEFSKKVSFEEFGIGKYPVSNLQFLHFIIETDHITEAERTGNARHQVDFMGMLVMTSKDNWWSRGFFGAQILHWHKYPVVYVSFNDAQAFCAWLSEKTGRVYRLPRANEWEIAVRGTKGLLFPWGNQFEANRCNTGDRRWKKREPAMPFLYADEAGDLVSNRIPDPTTGLPPGTTSVGFFSETDRSWCGAHDLIGNVWEWCDTPYIKNDGEQTTSKILKGGSYSTYHDIDLRKLKFIESPEGGAVMMAITTAFAGASTDSGSTKINLDSVNTIFSISPENNYELNAVGAFFADVSVAASNIGFRVVRESQ